MFFLLDSPILYILGYILVAYFVIMLISVYLGPAMFGSDPYYPYPYGPGPGPPYRYPYRREANVDPRSGQVRQGSLVLSSYLVGFLTVGLYYRNFQL